MESRESCNSRAALVSFSISSPRPVLDKLVAFVGGEHVCVAERPLDQRRQIGIGGGAATRNFHNSLPDELGDGDVMQFGRAADLLPFGIGEADAPGLAHIGRLVGWDAAGLRFRGNRIPSCACSISQREPGQYGAGSPAIAWSVRSVLAARLRGHWRSHRKRKMRPARFFGTSGEFWLHLQQLYELRHTEDRKDAEAEARKAAGVGIGLADDLRAIRTAIVKSHLASDFAAAFDLLVFQLARSVFTAGYHDDALDIRAVETPDRPALRVNDDAFATINVGEKHLETGRIGHNLTWTGLPDAEAFNALKALPERDKRALFASCVARTLKGLR